MQKVESTIVPQNEYKPLLQASISSLKSLRNTFETGIEFNPNKKPLTTSKALAFSKVMHQLGKTFVTNLSLF